MSKRSVSYIYDKKLRQQCDKLPTMRNRATLVHELIHSCGLLSSDRLTIVGSLKATDDELRLFHSSAYVEFIKNKIDKEPNGLVEQEQQESFGLTYDCPVLDNLYDFVTTIAGGSLSAARELIDSKNRVVVNWFGGWHHSQRDQAEGFCYVNDIAIAIQKLSEKFSRILYVDLDVHHGNGVQNAFEFSRKVLTLSFHKTSPGFFPGTGLLEDVGSGKGRYYSINVPFHDEIGDKTYQHIFTSIFPKVYDSFKPEVIVTQCGADVLREDPIGQCNVTITAMLSCVRMILDCDVPTMLLGGGGYNFPNTARYWTQLTALVLNECLSDDVPDKSLFFTEYGPTYEMKIYPGNMKDRNTLEHVNSVIDTVNGYCDIIRKHEESQSVTV